MSNFNHDTAALKLSCRTVPWDSEVFKESVAEITDILVGDPIAAMRSYQGFADWVRQQAFAMISCRLRHDQLNESALLEHNGFRFVEMVLHPVCSDIKQLDVSGHGLVVCEATEADLERVCRIAASAFGYERFHVDPNIAEGIGDERYRRWVKNSTGYDRQMLLKATLDCEVVAFFLVEFKPGCVYGHLTAEAPEFQGRGLGYRVWLAMLDHHRQAGAEQVATTISARNVPVLNLYSKLGFRFSPPEMTFHWTR